MAIDFVSPSTQGPELPRFPDNVVVPDYPDFVFDELDPTRSDTQTSVSLMRDHRALRAAAIATGFSFHADREALTAIQEKVDDWANRSEAEDPLNSIQRIRALAQHLGSCHGQIVGAYELDTTHTFLDLVEARAREHQNGVVVELEPDKSGVTIEENMPALAYVSSGVREKLIQGLPEEWMRLVGGEAMLGVVGMAPQDNDLQQNTSGKTVDARTSKEKQEVKFKLRDAREEDIPAMVDIDLRSFSKVYQDYDTDPVTHRADLREMFMNRFRLLGGKWMPVVTKRDHLGNERVVGFMIACPTNKGPNDFKSWEDITDNGTLNTLYDPKGKNMYIVTLSMDPSVGGERGYDQLYARQVGNLLSNGIEQAFFESRMRGLRGWVRRQCRAEGLNFDHLTDDEKMAFAERYAALTREANGRTVPYDPLLELYTVDFACNLERVVPNAYKDKQSMNFGALYTFDNPLRSLRRIPTWIRNSKLAGIIVGGSLGLASRSTRLTSKLMKAF